MDFDDLVEKKKIHLPLQDLRDGGLGVIIEVLQKSNVLEELGLYGNRLTLANGKMAEAIARSRTLRVLDLSYNQIAAKGAKRLADAIKANETLKEIYLCRNKIGDEGAKSFTDALAVNKSLRLMHLGVNGIGNEGARSLAASFEKNQTLESVHLTGNTVADEGALRLAESLKKNYAINHLFFGNNPISEQVREKIEAILNDESRKYVQNIIASKDGEISALKEEIASLKAASLKATVDLTTGDPKLSSKRPRTAGGS